MNHLFQNSTNNGRTGYALTKAMNNGSLRTVYNVTKGIKRVRPGMAKIGAGAQGVVYLASTDKAGKKKIVIKVSATDKKYSAAKQPARVEYDIQKALYKVAPRHIPKPIDFKHVRSYITPSNFRNHQPSFYDYANQMVMTSEYAHGGSLKDWMRKMGSRITDKVIADLVRQVVGTLAKIHARYPEFRHNDLHLGNIYVDDTKVKPRYMIADFGLSRLTARGSNPVVNNGSFRNSGISSTTSYKYDAHFFLNALDIEIRRGLPETKAFLERMLPTGYRGQNASHVKNSRLKNGAPNAPLPSFVQILSDPFLSGRSSPRRRASSSPNLSTGVMFQSPTPRRRLNNNTNRRLSAVMSNRTGRNAADIASNALAGLPGVSVSTTARRPSAAEFLRMSPRRRAALLRGTRGGEASRSVVVRNFARTRGANVVRETTRRVAVPRTYLPIAGLGRNMRTVANRISPTRLAARRLVNSTVRRVVARGNASPVRRASPVASLSPPRRRGSTPAARERLPTLSHREHTLLARTMGSARRNAGRTARARAPRARAVGTMTMPRAVVPVTHAKNIMNRHANAMNNQRTLTRRMLKKALTNAGYSATNANAHAREWEQGWIGNRASANKATRNLRAGKNVVKRGYTENAVAIARRRVAEGLLKGANGRVRAGKTLLSGKKKDELVAIARRHGIAGAATMTKDQIVNALYG